MLGERLIPLAQAGNPCASLLLRVHSSPGQSFLRTLYIVLMKPPNQDLVHSTLDLMREYYAVLRPGGDPDLPLGDLLEEARDFVSAGQASADVRACCEAVPELVEEIAAMRLFSGLGYGVLRPVLRDSTAIGSLMRRKLKPVTDVLSDTISLLRGSEGSQESV